MKLTIKDVISIVVLIAIAVILSGILTILNFVLYVSPEERTMRAIKKIYGEEKEYSVILDASDENTSAWEDAYGYGEISLIYKVQNQNDYDILFKSTGYKGYKGGSITCWVQVNYSGEDITIKKIIVESFDKQTLMSKVTSSFWSAMYVDATDAYNNKEWFFANAKDSNFKNDNPSAVLNPISNATYSATAGCNAVNCVIACVNEFNFGGNN
jgi:hypothetical protein